MTLGDRRDRGSVSSRLVRSERAGGVAAVLIMQAVTHSGFSDIGGPIDGVLVALSFLAGAIGTIIGAYALLGLVSARRVRRAAGEAGAGAARFAPLAR